MRSVLVVFACLLGACSGSGTSESPSSPAQACIDVADAFAKAAGRCGLDSSAVRKDFVRVAANGDCNNITSVRDEASFRAKCLPSFESVACASLKAGSIDDSCRSQLLRPKAFQDVSLAPASLGSDVGAVAGD